jgi:hypothetical protein
VVGERLGRRAAQQGALGLVEVEVGLQRRRLGPLTFLSAGSAAPAADPAGRTRQQAVPYTGARAGLATLGPPPATPAVLTHAAVVPSPSRTSLV